MWFVQSRVPSVLRESTLLVNLALPVVLGRPRLCYNLNRMTMTGHETEQLYADVLARTLTYNKEGINYTQHRASGCGRVRGM